ncbi:unnamed protein product [Symbiodinium microadriaticum]|nr:unnamed protein product [Symbiodinium microadriaticum]
MRSQKFFGLPLGMVRHFLSRLLPNEVMIPFVIRELCWKPSSSTLDLALLAPKKVLGVLVIPLLTLFCVFRIFCLLTSPMMSHMFPCRLGFLLMRSPLFLELRGSQIMFCPVDCGGMPPHVHIDYCDGIRGVIEGVDVFTDGSFDGSSSWAYVCVASTSAGRFVLAWARGVVALPGDDWWIGAVEHSALNGERSAVFWALSWILGVHSTIPCFLHCDCIVAAFQAAGTFGSSQSDQIAVACRSLAHVLEVLGKLRAGTIRHVKGHSGHPHNELADVLAGAKDVGVSSIPEHFRPFSDWVAANVIEWLWLAVASLTQPAAWLVWSHNHFVDPTGNSSLDVGNLAGPDFFGRQQSAQPWTPPHDVAMYLYAKFVTVNVQSLCEDERSTLPNRVPYVRAQLDHCGCAVAGLQETRAVATSTVISDTHIRFISARDAKGCLGVELWFSRKHPLLWKGSSPVTFEVNDFRVLYWTPHVLVVRYVKGTLRVLFVACHAPTATHPEREEWWKQFADLLSFTIQGDKVVILEISTLDSRSLSRDESVTSCGRKIIHLQTRSFVCCSLVICGYRPHIKSVILDRATHGLLPAERQLHALIMFCCHLTGGCHRVPPVFFITLTLVRQALIISLSASRSISDAVIACISPSKPNALMLPKLASLSPPVLFRPCVRICQRSVGTLMLTSIIMLSHSIFLMALSSTFLLVVRLGGAPFSRTPPGLFGNSGFGSVDVRIPPARSCKIGISDVLLRHGCFQSRCATLATPALLFYCTQLLSYAMPLANSESCDQHSGRRKQRGLTPLPALVLENGEFAATPEEADARWLRHFSAAEQGGPIEPDKMIQRCFNRQYEADLETFEVSARDIPTLWELESALRASKPGRAAGNDGIPPDILHKYAGQLSTALYPILLKIAFRLQEPLQFKGGTMRHIWKSKGPLEHCSSYRGILVSNTVGKSFHSAFRRKCGSWYDSAATPLQVGGRRGFPVQLAAQAARAYQAGHLSRGNSVAVIFLDLREAFHKVVRPLVRGGDLSDEHIAAVMQSLALGPSHFEELRKYLCANSRLRDAGASPWAAAVVKEFQTDSWLTVGSGLAVAETGTRPGDALADIVFSFLFSAVLGRVRDALLHRGYEVRLPWCEDWFRSLCRTSSVGTETLAPIDVSWMDDLALLVSANSASELISTVSGASAALLDECLRAMLHPNLDPGKTEALISLTGLAGFSQTA